MEKKEENKKILQSSLEYAICKKEMMLYSVMGAILLAILTILSMLVKSGRFFYLMIPFVMLYIPMLLVKLHQMKNIVTDCEDILFCEAVLTDPQAGFNATNYFTVTIEDSNGKRFKAYTNAIAVSRGMVKPHYTKLNNKRAWIAYNRVTEQVTVVKIL